MAETGISVRTSVSHFNMLRTGPLNDKFTIIKTSVIAIFQLLIHFFLNFNIQDLMNYIHIFSNELQIILNAIQENLN